MNIKAIWLRRIGDKVQVLVMREDGFWRLAIEEAAFVAFSHIAERGVLENAPFEDDRIARAD
jgi:hypothetical protein